MNPESLSTRLWSTDAVESGRRLDYWTDAICAAFLEMHCSSSQAATFEGRLTSVAVDVLSFNQVVACTQDVYRTSANIARGNKQPFYLIAQRDSAWHIGQHGQRIHMRPGDAVLVDSAQPYELHFPASLELISIELPRPWLGGWLAQWDSGVPRVATRDRGWGQALSGLCLQFAQDPALAASYPPALLSDQLGAMLAAALEPQPRGSDPPRRDLVARARQVLRERLAQTGLTAETVAQALGISVRTLHRGFAAEQASFAGTLRRLRLEQARQMLAQPRLENLTVAEVGRRCGFADASHFGREFYQVFGVTPARWRKSANAD